MAHDIELPAVFPQDEIRVKDEQHFFEVFQGDSGPLPKTEYTIDKAPITEIEEITGTLNGRVGHTFIKGTDYELGPDNTDVIWLSGGDSPDAGTNFFITYRAESIISRYIGSAEEEFDTVDERIAEAIQGKFVRQAEGRELDELGALFGQTIGKRRGRNDTQYRIYLQSVVQSFVSRGTKTGIKLAISAATDVPIDDITIEEDFESNEYEVIVVPDTPVKVSLIETIADIADPSGVNQILTRFPVFEDIGTDDTGGPTFNQFSVNDTFFLNDAVATPPVAADIIDDTAFDDTVNVPPKDAITTDTVGLTDATVSKRAEASEIIASADTTENFVREFAFWEEQTENHETEWNFFEWENLLELTKNVSVDTLGSTDTVTLQSPITTSDTAFSNDAVDVPPKDATTSDTAFFDDTFTGATQQSVSWDLVNWNESGFNWAKESN